MQVLFDIAEMQAKGTPASELKMILKLPEASSGESRFSR
jgi:hypothetical protein